MKNNQFWKEEYNRLLAKKEAKKISKIEMQRLRELSIIIFKY